jgi:hypothetical protein
MHRVDEPQFTHAEVLLRSDLANQKLVWTGFIRNDFECFLQNHHSVYSMVTAPALHPYTRKTRGLVLLSILGVSAAFYAATHFANSAKSSTVTSFVIEVLFTTLLAVAMSALARCATVQDKGFVARKRMEKIANTFLHAGIVFGILCGIWAFVFSIESGKAAYTDVRAFASSILMSFVFEMLIGIPMFAFFWLREKRNERNALQSAFHVSYLEFDEWQKHNTRKQLATRRTRMLHNMDCESKACDSTTLGRNNHSPHSLRTALDVLNKLGSSVTNAVSSVTQPKKKSDYRKLSVTADIADLTMKNNESDDEEDDVTLGMVTNTRVKMYRIRG